MKNILGLSLVLMFVAQACITPPEYPDEPVLTFVSYYKDTVRQSKDTNFITIAFTDGDGDLGAKDTDTTFNLFLTDVTIGRTFPFKMPEIPRQGIGNGISGEITITIYPTDVCCDSVDVPCLRQAGAADEVIVYEVQVEDRAGNLSSPLKLPPVKMICDY